VLVLGLIAGCGRLAFDPLGTAGGDGASGGDSSGSGRDGGGGDGADGSGMGVCGSTVLLADDFEDGVKAPEWTMLSGSNLTTAETGGFLQVTFGSNVPSNQTAGYVQSTTLDYTGTCTIVEIVEVPNATATGRLTMRIDTGGGTYVLFEVLQGTLYALKNDGNVNSVGSMPWNLATARFVRMREQAGTWYWDVSPDGTSYTQLATLALTLAGQTAAELRLIVTTSAGVNNGGQVQLGRVEIRGQ
jgi:hypothetical protein